MRKNTSTLLALMAVHGAIFVANQAEATLRESAPSFVSLPASSDAAALFSEAQERDFRQLTNMVWKAISERINAGKSERDREYVELTAIYADRAVVRSKERWFSYPYSITTGADDSEQVVLSSPREVVQQYVPVAGGEPAQREAAHSDSAAELLDASFAEAKDGSILVTIIRAGESKNANFYGDAALKAAVPMFEGVRVFAKSDAEHLRGGGKDVRNLIGGIYGVAFKEGKAQDAGALVGTFKALDPDDAVVKKMREAVKRGMTDLLGLSISASARVKPRQNAAGKKLREAAQFTKVDSVDLIVEPGAGGGLDQLHEAVDTASGSPTPSLNDSLTLGDAQMKQKLYEAIKAKDAARAAKIDLASISDELLLEAYNEVMAAKPAATFKEATGDDAPVTRAELQMLQTRSAAARSIDASKLPAAAKAKLHKQFDGMASFTEANVADAIKAEGEYLAQFTESGAVRVPGFGGIQVGDRSLAMRDMMEAFFDPAHKDHKKVRSFKECYIQITGDREVTGQIRNCDMSLMRESLGEHFNEAVTSGSFANALGDSITRRMQAIYEGMTDLQSWRRVATVGQTNDFRTQERIRIGGYGNLPIVAQSGAYLAMTTPTDEKATFAVAKRGGTESVTFEAIKNDDVGAIRAIPREMALAAANTLYEFAFDFYRTNPIIYDAAALYTVGKGNLFTAALSKAELEIHRQAMLKMTRAGSGKRLATAPKTILVPFELQAAAVDLFNRNTNNDKTFVESLNLDVLPVSYWTDASDWCTVADPMRLPSLEINFLDGREEPELFVQDNPTVGSLFTNDTITYKLRHTYGAVVPVDGFKATTKAVVA